MNLDSDVASPSFTIGPDRSTERTIPVEHIHRSPYRTVALTPGPSAIAAWLINPDAHDKVLVRRRPQGGYELLVGEFNWRVAQAARCDTIRVQVLEMADDGLARRLATLDADQDLRHLPQATTHEGVLPWSGAGKLVIARAIQLLHKDHQWSLTESARLFGLSRTEGAHYVRVLALPSTVLDLVVQGSLSFGQARALSRLSGWPTTALLLATKVAALPGTPARAKRRACSVREVERCVSETILRLEQDSCNGASEARKKVNAGAVRSSATARASGDLRRAEMLLTDHCGFPVHIEFDAKSHTGSVILRFASVDEFHVLADLLAPGIDFDEN